MDDPGACTEPELTGPVALCRPDGRLDPAAIGWARQPLIDCSLPGRWGRRKRWDFWCVTGADFAMNLTYAHIDYLGLADIWFHDFGRDATATATVPVPFGRGMHLPDHAGAGPLSFTDRRRHLSFRETPEGTALTVSFPTEHGLFAADLLVTRPADHESLTVVIPWSDRRYQCTTKDVARPASGTITWGDHRTTMTTDGRSWGCLDFGRGRWPYRTTWNWGAGAGLVGEERVGLQLGGKWTDGTGMTENALVVDGRLSKLSEELVWTYDREDWLRPWRVRTPRSDRVELTFTPIHDKVSRLQAGVAANAVDQCFGHWSGRVRPDDHDVIEIDGVFGWAEEATWRW